MPPKKKCTKYSYLNQTKEDCSYPIFIGSGDSMASTNTNPTSDGGAEKLCICDRESSAFFCSACDRFFYGRLSERCKLHPNVIFLLDQTHCVHCQAGQYMIRPVSLDHQTVANLNTEYMKTQFLYTKKSTTTE